MNNDTYLKVHDIETKLVDKNDNIITKDINYEFQSDKNYLGISAAMYENLTSNDLIKQGLNIPFQIFYLSVICLQEIRPGYLI